MERYQHVVRFSTFGHTHDEGFRVALAMNTTEAYGMYLVTGSGTTGYNENPTFSLVEFDAEYMVPVNSHTYFMNLSLANAGRPQWAELHDFIGEYGLADLSPSSMKKLSERMYNDSELASLYLWNLNRRGTERPVAKINDLQFKCLVTTEEY